MIDIFAWIVPIVLIATLVAIFVALGMMPGHIARKRGHPWAEAVAIGGCVLDVSGDDLQMLQWTAAGGGGRFMGSCTTPTPRANGPTTASRTSASSTRAGRGLGQRLDHRRHETGLEDDLSVPEVVRSDAMKKLILVAALAAFCAPAVSPAQNPSADDLARRSVHRRAVEAVIWGMPAVNLDLMLQAMIGSAKGKPNQIVYWSRLPDWKNQTLTPNPDVIYLMPFFNTKDAGPMVLEIPPADDGVINGTIMDAWQVPLEDVGPAGVDKGKGGKYLILPPDYKGTPPSGYIALPSMNYQGYALLRSILRSGSDADVAKAVAYGRRIKLYPLSQAANPPATTFVDAIDVVYDSTIPYELRFFQSLDRVVQIEPWLPRDRLMIDMLKSIGIEKGKPFKPDAKTQEI
ncbi:MAG TPA: DUF1254 domain-containing protein, partial [Mesorhizobium sp.]|nr:DUF1254 domain-containing protein [Mesorhizobium sp.]